jgi:predicted methyltransferase MtxX (methanogen marker protein 4)
LPVGAAVDKEIDDRVQIVILAVEFVGDLRQILRLHQLKLMAD